MSSTQGIQAEAPTAVFGPVREKCISARWVAGASVSQSRFSISWRWRARQLGGPGSAPASSRNCGAGPVCAMCGRGKSPSAWISPISPIIGSRRSRAHIARPSPWAVPGMARGCSSCCRECFPGWCRGRATLVRRDGVGRGGNALNYGSGHVGSQAERCRGYLLRSFICYWLYTPLNEAPDRLAATPIRGSPYQYLSRD